jgi:RNA polymerase sigma-70 factor (ECF subfamily)
MSSDAPHDSLLAALARTGAPSWLAGREEDFVAFVRARAGDASATLTDDRVVDFALVFGCIEGDDAALRDFDRRVLSALGRLLRNEPDTKQELVMMLFVRTPSSEARALRYSGKGAFRSWVRSAALNLLRTQRRRAAPTPSEDTLEHVPAGDEQVAPDSCYDAEEETAAFMSALDEAARALDAREREVLRLHVVERQAVLQIAAHFDVHRETAGRWLEAARTRLAEATSRRLEAALQISSEAARKTIGDVIDRGHASLGRLLLASEATPETNDP